MYLISLELHGSFCLLHLSSACIGEKCQHALFHPQHALLDVCGRRGVTDCLSSRAHCHQGPWYSWPAMLFCLTDVGRQGEVSLSWQPVSVGGFSEGDSYREENGTMSALILSVNLTKHN